MTGTCVNFGGAIVAAESDDAAWLAAVRETYAPFLTDGPAQLTVRYTPTAECNPWAVPDGDHRVSLLGPPQPERLGNIVRPRMPELVCAGLVCHAALLGDGERGYLCCGASGAGKSTLARLLPERAIGDEVVVVREHEGEPWVTPAPFGNAHHLELPLAGVFVIRHGSTTVRTRIRGSRALALLSEHVSWPTDDPAALEHAFDRMTRVIQQVPVWDLPFVPTADVWSVIAEAE